MIGSDGKDIVFPSVTVKGKCVGCEYTSTCSLMKTEDVSKNDISQVFASNPIELAPRSCRERKISSVIR